MPPSPRSPTSCRRRSTRIPAPASTTSRTTCCGSCSSAATRRSRPEAQTTLTLKLVAGLSTREIARAYLAPEATVAQRVSRAKRTLAEAGAAIEEPSGPERAERLATVLGVVYLLFNEGYSATEGEDWTRPALCDEAVRLGRILTALVPDDPEVHGLSALMELQSSRLAARAGPDGEPILLDAQDRRRWDAGRIRRGLDALARADALTAAAGADAERGPYALQAAIAAEHARAASVDDTDWDRDRRPLRGARAAHRVAGGRAQPRRRTRAFAGTRGRARAARPARGRAGAARLPPRAERARRPLRAARVAASTRPSSSNAPRP